MVLSDAQLEPAILAGNDDAPVQFERLGYFKRDEDSTPARPVFVRTIGLRDTYARTVAGG